MKEDEIKFISEPLLTEEGFLNVNGVKELENAINNMPKTYERLADDPEWSEKRWTFKHEILGAFAKWAVRLSPYNCPDDLGFVLNYLGTCLERSVNFNTNGMAKLSLCDINKLLHDILYEQGIEQFDNWNKCKAGNTPDISYSDRYSEKPNPDNDFIGIDALLHNTCLDIRLERRDFDKFNKEFEEQHGALE